MDLSFTILVLIGACLGLLGIFLMVWGIAKARFLDEGIFIPRAQSYPFNYDWVFFTVLWATVLLISIYNHFRGWPEKHMEPKYRRMIQGMKKKGGKDWTVYILRCGDGSLYTGSQGCGSSTQATQWGSGCSLHPISVARHVIISGEWFQSFRGPYSEAQVKRCQGRKRRRSSWILPKWYKPGDVR